jgi:hypothetical protein
MEPIESFEDLIKVFEKKGYNFSDFKYENDFYLAQKCEMLAAEVWEQTLPPDKRTEANIIPEMLLHGAFYTFLVLMGSPRNLYGLTPEALDVIKNTKLSADIGDLFIADLIDEPYFLYSLNQKPLFDDVQFIALFIDDADYLDCIINLKNGSSFNNVIPFDDIKEIVFKKDIQIADNPANKGIIERGLTDDLKSEQLKINKGILFFAKFLLLLNCEKTPIIVDYLHPAEKKSVLNQKKDSNRRSVSYKKISLTTEYKFRIEQKNAQSRGKVDKSGKVLVPIKVSGHIRSQPYGKDNKLRKLIYIEEHESTAWVCTEIRKIKVLE